ncbi:Cytochrome oxidase assembly protein shy1 [Frankliniella fusca]|uniref:Cytochrome oxidase assembly protein shy1 n=1 Tax=Frankliniella fusca TaxID=407009 RepID=A0AAE1HMN6_9NEOP|nr:Cytochrome oxidase assembly protein shy1 [Frankliniella fusca]
MVYVEDIELQTSLQTCLLQYRITPLAGLDASPAQLLMSRQLRSTIPVHVTKLKPSIIPNVKANLIKRSQISKDQYDKSANRKEIEFSPSDYVFMQNPLTHIWEYQALSWRNVLSVDHS